MGHGLAYVGLTVDSLISLVELMAVELEYKINSESYCYQHQKYLQQTPLIITPQALITPHV